MAAVGVRFTEREGGRKPGMESKALRGNWAANRKGGLISGPISHPEKPQNTASPHVGTEQFFRGISQFVSARDQNWNCGFRQKPAE